MSETDCWCGFDGDWLDCCNGTVYGPCEDEGCGGVCEPKRECTCECHEEGR